MSRPAATLPARAAPVLWLGTLLALLSAVTFALNVTLAGVVYAEGGNVHAVNLVRPPCFALALLLLLRASGAPLLLEHSRRVPVLAIGVLMCAFMYALLGAILFIPVGLAVLLMYLAPLLLAAFACFDGSERPRADRLLAMTVALAGLALALDVTGEMPDARGVGLGLLTALVFALTLWFSARSMGGEDRRTVMLHATLVTSVIVLAITAAGVEPVWPASKVGWLALAGTVVMFIIATFTLFTAVGLLGALRTAVIDTTSPVWGMAFGLLLLDQHLGPMQMAGAALVLLAVMHVQLRENRRAQPLPHP